MTLQGVMLGACIFLLDQGTKLLVTMNLVHGERIAVLPFFDLVRWHNEGAAFSVLASAGGWQRWFFVALGVGFCGFLLYELRRLPKGDKVMWVVYGLILGGALGNLVDRLFQGHVVDFLLFHWGSAYFPAFNVADSALFCGAALWILMMVQEYRAERANDA